MQHRLGAEGFGLGNGGAKRLPVIVTVGNYADFQVAPPRGLYPMPG
jgi:hypothetical protein